MTGVKSEISGGYRVGNDKPWTSRIHIGAVSQFVLFFEYSYMLIMIIPELL